MAIKSMYQEVQQSIFFHKPTIFDKHEINFFYKNKYYLNTSFYVVRNVEKLQKSFPELSAPFCGQKVTRIYKEMLQRSMNHYHFFHFWKIKLQA